MLREVEWGTDHISLRMQSAQTVQTTQGIWRRGIGGKFGVSWSEIKGLERLFCHLKGGYLKVYRKGLMAV